MPDQEIIRYDSEGPGDRRRIVNDTRGRAILIRMLGDRDPNHGKAMQEAAARLREAAELLEPWADDGIPPFDAGAV